MRLTKQTKVLLLWFAAAMSVVAIPVLYYTEIADSQGTLPEGCDHFGYLNMAKAISNGRLLSDHTRRPFHKELVAFLKQSDIPYGEYAWMIAPHAYHVEKNTEKVINQYPPGTSLILSFIPIEYRYVAFPALCAFFLVVCMLMMFHWGTISGLRWVHLGIVVITSAVIFRMPPYRGLFAGITSTAPTFGFLIAAGFLLRSHPRWATFFLGLSINFRVANAVLFVPMMIIVCLDYLKKKPFVFMQLVKAGWQHSLLFVSGASFYIVYAWLLLGSPLRPTYSTIDQAVAATNEFQALTRYYLTTSSPWFISHLLLTFLIVAIGFLKRQKLYEIFVFLLIPIVNYMFYLTHQIKIDYYPYATSVLLLGILIKLVEAPPRWMRQLVYTAMSVIALLAVVYFHWPQVDVRTQFFAEVAPYKQTFQPYDVVWEDMRSGTVEYAANTAGFRFLWGPPKVRYAIMKFLQQHGYKQAVWPQPPLPAVADIETALKKNAIEYRTIKNTPKGTIIEILPK
jgi:hypothetical protein